MLRNRKEQDSRQLRGVIRTEEADSTKLEIGVAETLQNIIPDGLSSWQKKRGVRYLDDNA